MQDSVLEHHMSNYKDLSVVQVKSFPNISIRQGWLFWGFYGHSTIKHDYNLKTIKGDKVVVDNATGLMWHQSGSDDEKEEGKAKEWVEDLNSEEGYAGYNDWRLPTVDEAASLLESSEKYVGLSIDPVFSNSQSHVWARDRDGTVVGWRVYFANGNERRNYIYSSLRCCVRPVRSDLSKDSGEELEEEDYDTIESYKQAIRINPDDASAHYNLGVTYYELGMYKEMIESCKQAIKIDPDDASVHNNLGLAYGKSGKYEEAIESYKQALRIDPDDAKVHNNLGVAYIRLNKYKEAIESYKLAIKIKPDDADAHYNLGVAYTRKEDKGESTGSIWVTNQEQQYGPRTQSGAGCDGM